MGDFLNKGALLLCVVLAAADLVVVILEVITRMAGTTFVWTEELSRWFLVWITFIGSSVVLKENKHIRVEFFITVCPEKIGKWINLAGQIGILFFFCFFSVLSWQVAVDAIGIKGDVIMLPMFYAKLALFIGGVLMVVHQIHAVVTAFRSSTYSSETTEKN